MKWLLLASAIGVCVFLAIPRIEAIRGSHVPTARISIQ